MEHNNEPVILLENISKTFGGIYALDGVTFELGDEIHSIVGHNGAGKSTLVRILMGALQPDSGKIYLKGKPVSFSSPREAQDHKIAMVWQELANFPNLTITENLLMQRFRYNSVGQIDWKASHELCRQYLDRINLDVDPATIMGKMPLAQQQLVEFAKAMSYDPNILILDEPTSALSFTEQEILYEKIKMIRAQGVSVIFISHKLEEVMALSDRVTVLRDGHRVFTKHVSELTKDMIVEGIVGKASEQKQKKKADVMKPMPPSVPVILKVENLSMERRLKGISFDLRKGEILGITGVSGSGISEVGQILFGIERKYTGSIYLDGKPIVNESPRKAVMTGFGYVPKNRKEEGIVPQMSVGDNIVLSALKEISVSGFVSQKKKNPVVGRIMETIDLRPRNPEISIESLSGGNQQKGVIARWMSRESRILILDEPTRGVDVGAIQKIYALIREMAAAGLSVIVISSEFEEIHSVANRMIVLNRGDIAGEIYPQEHSWEDAFALAVK